MKATISKEIVEETVKTEPLQNTTKANTYIVTTQKTVVKDEQPAFDYSVVVAGVVVEHAKFGTGKIVRVDNENNRVHIVFGFGEKMFVLDTFERGIIKIK